MSHPTLEDFLKNVSSHQMTVKHSDGIYRHVRFSAPKNSWNMWFDLVTWPGFLTISGDMGCWKFSRVPDMFCFFRSHGELEINPSYWAEKLQHGQFGGREGARVFNEDLFKRQIVEQLTDYYGFEGEDLSAVKAALTEDVLRQDSYDLRVAARDFKFRLADGQEWCFDACELPDGKEYCYHFIWCLYAIVWGIRKWDEERPVNLVESLKAEPDRPEAGV